MNKRRVRIVATLGPAVDQPGVLEGLIRTGLDVARINLSHGSRDEHVARVSRLRQLAAEADRDIAVLADLPGPKLRVVLSAAMPLSKDSRIIFADDGVAVTEPRWLDFVKVGHRILLDDGRMQLRVESARPGRIEAIVNVGGLLQPGKGVNLPDSTVEIPAITPRDFTALESASKFGADLLALSFVRNAEAADDLRRAAADVGLNVSLIAKIERPEAVANIARIVAAFDAIMVARGDLGVEMPLERVPVVQKRLIAEARAHGKPVITATDMLDSMRTNPRPTRAEASDVANAVCDGTDAIMLSGETAVGQYPLEALACMDRIARQAEADLGSVPPRVVQNKLSLTDELAACAAELAQTTDAKAIIVPTLSGRTAIQVAQHRPKSAIVAPVPTAACRRSLAIVWGVQPVPFEMNIKPGSDRIEAAVHSAFRAHAVSSGDLAVVLAGHPVEGGDRWPTIRLVRIGPNGTSLEP